MRKMTDTLTLVVLGLLLLNGMMFLQQPAMVFYPIDSIYQTPKDWGLEYEEVWMETEDGVRLHGWYLPRPEAEQVLLFFHGMTWVEEETTHRGPDE